MIVPWVIRHAIFQGNNVVLERVDSICLFFRRHEIILNVSKDRGLKWQTQNCDWGKWTISLIHDDNFPIKVIAGEGRGSASSKTYLSSSTEGRDLFVTYLSFRELLLIPTIIKNRDSLCEIHCCLFFQCLRGFSQPLNRLCFIRSTLSQASAIMLC